MPTTVQPVIVTPSIPLLLAFYKALGVERRGRSDRRSAADLAQRERQRSGVGNVTGLLEHVEALGGRVLGPPNDMPWGQRVAHIQDPDGNTVNLTEPI